MNPIFPLVKKNHAIVWLVITVLMVWLTAGTCLAATETVLDTFSEKSYSNQDGTAEWSSDWQEYNDDNNPKSEIWLSIKMPCGSRGVAINTLG